MKSSPNLEAQNATLKTKLKRARARIRKMKESSSPANVQHERPTDKQRQPYIVANEKGGKNAEGSQLLERRKERASQIIVLVPGVDVGEILKRIA